MGLKSALKNVDAALGLALGISFIVHAVLFGLVASVELPPPPSQADYTDWVKKIATPRREAVILPPPVAKEAPIAAINEKEKPKEEVSRENESAGSNETRAKGPSTASKGGPRGGAQGGGQGTASKEGLRQRVGNSGVLGVIGVNSGKGGDFADVFSSKKAVSEDAAKGAAGKGGGSLSTTETDLGARGTGKGNQANSTVADIGGIAPKAKANGSGELKTGSHKEADLKPAKVGGGAAEALSGSVDRKSMSEAISKKASGFRRCYERGLNANPNLAGKLVFEITIDPTGKVVDIRFTEDTLRSAEVVDCVRGILMRISFANADGGLASFKSSLFFEPPR